MKSSKRFQHSDGFEYELTIEQVDTMTSSGIRWMYDLRKREVGKRRWQRVIGSNKQFSGTYSDYELYLKQQRWVLRQVPLEWWKATYCELSEKINTCFEFNLIKNYNIK